MSTVYKRILLDYNVFDDSTLLIKKGVKFMKKLVTGSLTLKREIYQIVLSWKENDKRKQKWISTGLTEKGNYREATRMLKKAIEEKEEDLNSSKDDDSYNPLFSEYLKKHLEEIKPLLQESTYTIDKNRINNIIAPYFEEKQMRIKDITRQTMETFYQERIALGNHPKTAKKYIICMSRCFKYAMSEKEGLLEYNPATGIGFKKSQDEYVAKYLTTQEVNQLLKIVKGEEAEFPILFAIYYGLRRSEIIGLKWSSIDFDSKLIRIENKIVQLPDEKRTHTSRMVSSPNLKRNASRRTLPLLAPIEEQLLILKKKIEENRKFFGKTYNKKYLDYICVKPNGDIIKPNYVTNKFKKYMEDLNIDKGITFHGLRHTCATVLLGMGFSLKEIQAWLGHSNYQTTADIYAHVDLGSKVSMGKKIESTFSFPSDI